LLASAARRAALALLLVILAGLAALTAQASNALANKGCVDVALVLAVDGSGSVNAREYNFQKSAIAASFRDPEVLKALKRAGTVSIAVVFWGDPERATQSTDTVQIRDPADAEALARMVEKKSRTVLGNTGLGAGLAAAMDKLATMGCAYRSIVNVSGDGQETTISRRKRVSLRPQQARARAQAEGITINALVISNEAKGLAEYYARTVITGPQAFVMEVNDYGDYAVALRRKLIREISPSIVSQVNQEEGRLK
jgi:hypothetical protein